MPELRKDPVVGRWVIIATERGARPSDFSTPTEPPDRGFCPFCEGNEDKTPREIMALRDPGTDPDGPGWRVRVVPNKYPALQVEGALGKAPHGLFDTMNGIGAHEVIIESSQHHTKLTQLPLKRTEDMLWVYRDRLIDLKRDRRFAYGMIFKNVGSAAGASLEHTHSQLIVTPIVPDLINREMNGSKQYYDYRGRCLFCDIVSQEIAEGSRIVVEDENFVSFTPFASRFPFEMWLMPKTHQSHFENVQRLGIDELADVLRRSLMKLEGALEDPPYNYIIHTGPFTESDLDTYHWHIEIIPRLTKVAGFEWGTGFYINPVAPEDAAEFLRQSPDGPGDRVADGAEARAE